MRRIQVVFICGIAAFLLMQAVYSLRWPIAHDAAPLFYESFLMNVDGRVPYRDIFDFQMPGSYAVFYLFGKLTSFIAFRVRILDLGILSAILLITYTFMRRFGKPSALLAGILFGLKYLQGGPSMSLQREYLLIPLIALAVWIGMRDSLTVKHRLSLGLLFGISACIKPHAALGLLPFLLIDIHEISKRLDISLLKAAVKSILPVFIGFSVPVAAALLWLAFTNALNPFISIALNYWPLYSQVNGRLEINTGMARSAFIFDQLWQFGGHGMWLIPAGLGVYLNRNKQTYLLAGLALCYAIYPAFSGQFFPYHYIPFIYLIVLLASLSLGSPATFKIQYSSLILLAVILLTVRPSTAFTQQLQGKPVVTSTDRAKEITRYLEENLKDGDTVQPLDWTGGALLAMLEARAQLATPYIFDFYFYHHVSEPYIRSLRADFMKDLQTASPRFIVEVTAIDKPWISGRDTSRDFPELRTFLNGNYSVTIHKTDYVIYIRK
jgi:hypothetical protein